MNIKSPLHELYRRPGFLLKRCQQVTAAIFIEECREFNLTPSQYGALWLLREFPGIDQIALGRLTGLDRSTIGLVIKLLTERDLIERSANQRDKRRMHLKLSKAGEQLLAEVAPAARRAQERVLAGLPRTRQGEFLELLEAFLEGHDALINVSEILEGTNRAEQHGLAGAESGKPSSKQASRRDGAGRSSAAARRRAPSGRGTARRKK